LLLRESETIEEKLAVYWRMKEGTMQEMVRS